MKNALLLYITELIMNKNRFGYKWDVVKDFVYQFNKIPCIPAVYIFVIRKPGTKYNKIVYIGATKNLFNRIRVHSILTLLRYNINNFVIDIYYANIDQKVEKKLIIQIRPVFNKGWTGNDRLTQINFWKEHNVTKIVWRFRQVYNL